MTFCQALSKPVVPWKILIADDDQDVHVATKLALRDVSFRDRTLQFIDAYSASETLLRLKEHPDTAVVFLDVIMESDDAGLGVARKIRENGFSLVRLIIRTGYPGQAPEREVIVHYDIHDYKEKSGLTTQKLFTSLISALRSYDDLLALEQHRRGLMSVLESVSWFDFGAVQRYIAGMLSEFSDLARLPFGQVLIAARFASDEHRAIKVVASCGELALSDECPQPLNDLPLVVASILQESFAVGEALQSENGSTLFVSCHGVDLVAYADGQNALANADVVLLEVFLVKVCQALANFRAFQNISAERDGLLLGLAHAAERRNGSGVDTLEQLASLCEAVVRRLDTMLDFPELIDEAFLRNIGKASLLHDLGDLDLPVGLLDKAGTFNQAEAGQMREHVEAGLRLVEPCLRASESCGCIALASQVIAAHHEHFDGSGYPHALSGEAIPLAGRVVAVVDTYVAMTSNRPHRDAISPQEAVTLISAKAGRQFDPRVVQAFLHVFEEAAR